MFKYKCVVFFVASFVERPVLIGFMDALKQESCIKTRETSVRKRVTLKGATVRIQAPDISTWVFIGMFCCKYMV
jgi:hypothetical protein